MKILTVITVAILLFITIVFFYVSFAEAREQPRPLNLHEKMQQLHYDIARKNHINPGIPETWNKRNNPRIFDYQYNRKHSTYEAYRKHVINNHKAKR